MGIFACPEFGDAICFFIIPFAGMQLNLSGGRGLWGAYSSVIRSMLRGERELLQARRQSGFRSRILSGATVAPTIDMTPQPWRSLPVQAGAVGGMHRKTQLPDDVRMRMHAAPMIGRAVIEGELQTAISEAQQDVAVLFKQKRIKEN